MTQDETMVVLDDDASDQELPVEIKVVQRVSRRVFTVSGDDSVLARMPLNTRYLYVGRRPPPEVLQTLRPDERLFVEGWLSRAAGKAVRPGEGLPWDADGMTPPDLPRHDQGGH